MYKSYNKFYKFQGVELILITKKFFGTMNDGRDVFNYIFTDEKNQSVVISEYACAILEINILGNDGKFYDVALGYDTLKEYIDDTRNFGATIGRFANRIRGGKFVLNGTEYKLPQNDGNNTLHGGFNGFGKKLFSSEVVDDVVIFRLNSPDLDEGFPGNFDLTVKTSFRNNALRFDYEYVCDKDTPASITNHNYFNLNGHDKGTILNHEVFINSEKYCRADDELMALAPVVPVEGTPFDFRVPKKISEGIYDHCFEILRNEKNLSAYSVGDETGIKLEIFSDLPAIQFYTGNMIGEGKGKNGAAYKNFCGVAIECQQFPNAVNEPSFPNSILKARRLGKSFIEYKFSLS